MKKLLLRLFVKNHADTRNPAVRTQYGKLAGITGIFCNFNTCTHAAAICHIRIIPKAC